MKIRRIDMEPVLKKAMNSPSPSVFMEIYKGGIQRRIMAGEHIHLYGGGVEECIYPTDRCYEGVRRV